MKKLIILLTILISTIFSNVAFADIIVPGDNCHDYDKTCYEKCLKSGEYKSFVYEEKGKCIEKCCIKNIKWCKNENCKCLLEGNAWPYCKFDSECKWDCTNGENISFFERYISLFKYYGKHLLGLFFILFAGIFIYKRKKKKG